MRTNITRISDRIRYLLDTGGIQSAITAYIGDTANANVTLGLTINQGAADDAILELKSSDVNHGVTTVTETDTFGSFKKRSATDGGLIIRGLADTNTEGLSLEGISPTDDTTKTTAGVGVITLFAEKISGTGVTTCGADANLVAIVNNSTTRFLFDAEGSGHADVEWVAF